MNLIRRFFVALAIMASAATSAVATPTDVYLCPSGPWTYSCFTQVYLPPISEPIPRYYEISGVGSGSVGNTVFNNTAFKFTLTPNFADEFITFQYFPIRLDRVGTIAYEIQNALIQFEGIGTATLGIQTVIGLNARSGNVYLGKIWGADLFEFTVAPTSLFTQSPVLFGPVAGTDIRALDQFVDVPSNLGAITFSTSSDVTFRLFEVGTPVSEPGSIALLLIALVACITIRRRALPARMLGQFAV
jgi:hypothetical protein